MRRAKCLIIGQMSDEHVTAVTGRLSAGETVIMDLDLLGKSDYLLDENGFQLIGRPPLLNVESGGLTRGWLRRLGPPDWQDGVVLGSKEAASKAAWATLLATVIRTTSVRWLTDLDDLNRAENKLAQYRAALIIGVPTPRTAVTSDHRLLSKMFGDVVVIKSLGPGHFVSHRGLGQVVFSAKLETSDERLTLLKGAPFIAQQAIEAREHLRVVTVNEQTWGCALSASNLPLDWRRVPIAHREFLPVALPERIISWAQALGKYFRLGYSSQDWIIDQSGKAWFIDLNPSGQWLFLPEAIASEITESIITWLQSGGVE